MTTIKRIARNTTLLLFAQIIGYTLSFFYIVYTAKYLGAENFGVLSFALAFTAIFAVLTDIGLQRLTVREVARDKKLAPKYLSNLISIKLLLSAATFLFIAIVINLMNYPSKTVNIVYIITISVIISSFTTMLYSIFQAHEKMEYESIGQIISSALMFGGALIAIKLNLDVTTFSIIYLLSSIIIITYSIIVLKIKFPEILQRSSSSLLELDLTFLKHTIKEALPFAFAIFFTSIFYWTDSVMLSFMKGDEVVGWYNIAYKMTFVVLYIPAAFGAAFFPLISNLHLTSIDTLKIAITKSFKYLAILGIPISVGTTLLAPRLILMLFGKEYSNAIIPLQILAWSIMLIFMITPLSRLFQASNRQIIPTKIAGLCATLNIVINLILIPRYSMIGASIATVLTELLSLGLALVWCVKLGYGIPNKKFVEIIIKVMVSSAFMGGFILYFYNLPLWSLVPAAILLYFTTLLIIKGINKEDVKLALDIIR